MLEKIIYYARKGKNCEHTRCIIQITNIIFFNKLFTVLNFKYITKNSFEKETLNKETSPDESMLVEE